MASTVHLLVATADREIYRGEASMVVAPGSAGDLGIYPKHAPLLCSLKAGELRVTKSDGVEVDEVFVSGGFMEVQPDMITVLADCAERAADVDMAATMEAARAAEELIAGKKDDLDFATAEAELAVATAKLAWLRKKKI
ncbi:MAG: F0F1 ATP synthase subunit epsilon [Zetaproteobacteria bacterium]|nr:F0F1 ATP synthase subunit epsilon [Zetaproteobacteria bacterium]